MGLLLACCLLRTCKTVHVVFQNNINFVCAPLCGLCSVCMDLAYYFAFEVGLLFVGSRSSAQDSSLPFPVLHSLCMALYSFCVYKESIELSGFLTHGWL